MEILKYVNRVNLSIILGLCLAFNPFSLVNAYEVRVGTSPTTTYRYLEDQNIPSKGGNSRDLQIRGGANYSGKLIGNGPNLSQSMGGGVTIEGLKGGTKVTATAKYSKKGVAKGLSRGLKFGKFGGPYGLAITTGLGLAIDKLIEEGGEEIPDHYEFNDDGQLVGVYEKGSSIAVIPKCEDTSKYTEIQNAIKEATSGIPHDPAPVGWLCDTKQLYREDGKYYEFWVGSAYKAYNNEVCNEYKTVDFKLKDFQHWPCDNFRCGLLVKKIPKSCYSMHENKKTILVDDSIIDLADSIDPDRLFDKWNLGDYENIYSYIDENPQVFFDVPDSIVHDVSTSSFMGADGNNYTLENVAKTDFSVDSSGGLSSQTSEIQNTYKDGNLIDTQVNISNTNISSSSTSSNNSAPASDLEIPTDCDLFPSQCRHNEWVETSMDTPPPDSSVDFSDLGVNVTLDDVHGVDVNFGEASCPAPLVVDLIIFEPVEITFYFMCEHARSAKPFILISASLFALYIILGSNRGKA